MSAVYRTRGKRGTDCHCRCGAGGLGASAGRGALAVLVTMGRPVLFRQYRPGLLGRPFTLLKFRTMTSAQDADGALLPMLSA